jgi:peptide/nickel transport system substrate-binding protein
VGEASAENWHRFGLAEAEAVLAELEATRDPAREAALYAQLQRLFVAHAPAIPLFPGPLWGQYSSRRFDGFPHQGRPYAPLSPHWKPQTLLVLTELTPR